MKNTNDYINAYLFDINHIKSKKSSSKVISKKSLSKNILLENTRKLVKKRLINEDSKQSIECTIDVVVEYYEEINGGGIPQEKLWAMPDFIFDGHDNYQVKDVTQNHDIANQLGIQVKNIISTKGVEEELAKRNKQVKQGNKWCTLYFIEMGQQQDGKKGAPLFFLADRSSKPHIYQIIPKQQNILQKAQSQLRMYQSKGGDFQVLSATGSVGLTILSAGWGLIQGIGGVFADMGKSLIKGTPLEKWFSSKDDKGKSKGKDKDQKKKKKNFNEETKPIIAALIKYVKQKGQGYKGLSAQNKAKLNFITGITPDKPVQGVFNYKKLLDSGEDITKQQFDILNKFRQELASSLALDKCDQMDPAQVQKTFNENPGTPQDLAKARQKIKNFDKKCHSLGFRDKKAMTGFAAFFMSLLNKLMNLLGGNTQKKEATTDKIKEACPYIASQIGKSIQPGKYPIYFGKDIHNVSDEEMKVKFETYSKN